MEKKHFLFLSNRRDREPNPELWCERQRANHYPRAPPCDYPVSTKHLCNICSTSAQRLRRDVGLTLYKCFVFTGLPMTEKMNV